MWLWRVFVYGIKLFLGLVVRLPVLRVCYHPIELLKTLNMVQAAASGPELAPRKDLIWR